MQDGENLARFGGISDGIFNFIFGEARACRVRRWLRFSYRLRFSPSCDNPPRHVA